MSPKPASAPVGYVSPFESATLEDYLSWLQAWLVCGGGASHYYDYPFERWRWLIARRDFTTGGECGSKSVNIVVPKGVRHITGSRGHNKLFLLDGPVVHGQVVPVFDNPEFRSMGPVMEMPIAEERWAGDNFGLDNPKVMASSDVARYRAAAEDPHRCGGCGNTAEARQISAR